MDLLPQVRVDLIQEDPEPLEEEFMSDEEEEPEPVKEQVLPEVSEKVMIPEEDIFVDKKPKKKVQNAEPKKKRQVSEEQLERLRKGREKALAVRRAKAQEKKEIKDLQDKKKKKDIQKLREEVEEKPKEPAHTPPPTPRKTFNSLDDLPADMLVELQKRAIEGYDMKRKARKEEKKKSQQHTLNNNINRDMINNALKPQLPKKYGDAGYFSDCF
jgi:hypothetical protein